MLEKELFQMPFEGDLHHGTIMMLPYRMDTWREGGKVAYPSFLAIIRAIAQYEKVYVLIDKRVSYDISELKKIQNVVLIDAKYDDCWSRDTSPIFVYNKNKKLTGIDFRFNAWGGSIDGLYADYRADDRLAEFICKRLKTEHEYVKDFILEGGSIHTDGQGTFLTTEACLLSKGRNPKLTKEQIESYLVTYLGAKKVLWLPRGIYNDETNEHVDNVACFVKPGVIALAWTDDINDPQYPLSKLAFDYLKTSTDVNGKPFEIVKIKIPTPMYLQTEESNALKPNEDSKPRLPEDRLAGSYINYYLGSNYVILPKFGCKEDEEGYNTFKKLYPNHHIHQIDTKEILLGGGNIHCITMQIPELIKRGE